MGVMCLYVHDRGGCTVDAVVCSMRGGILSIAALTAEKQEA